MKIEAKAYIWVLVLCFVTIADFKVYAAENEIEIVTYKLRDSPTGKFLDLVYTEAFKRLGKTFIYKEFPAKRSSYMLNLKIADGELSRIYSFNDAHPNAIRVEEPHWESQFIAVAADPSIHLNGWESLRGTDYRVDYKRGIKGCEVNLPKVVPPENLEVVNEVYQGLGKILAGRTDIFVGAEWNIVSLLESAKFKNSKLRRVGVMEIFTAHMFLLKKHKELTLKLSDVLKDMKREGFFEKYREKAKLIAY